MLEVGCARETLHQRFAKLGVLRREHLRLHAAEAASVGHGSGRPIVSARLVKCDASGIDDADVFLAIR
jgi:hypothetical protein